MEPRFLKPYAKQLTAAAKTLEQAIEANDPELILAAHRAVGRVRERISPQVGWVTKNVEKKEAPTAGPKDRAGYSLSAVPHG